MRRRIAIIAVPIVAAALAAGCGGGEEEPEVATIDQGPTGATGATGALSQEAFIRRADDICAEANAAIANLSIGDVAESAQLRQEVSITEGMVESLESLGEPAEDSQTVERFMSALREVVDALEREQLAVSRGDDVAAQAAAAEADSALAEARALAEELGFEDCGQEGEAIRSDDATGPDPGTEEAAPPVEPAPAPAPAPEPAPAPAPAPPSGGAGPDSGAAGGGGGGSGGVSP